MRARNRSADTLDAAFCKGPIYSLPSSSVLTVWTTSILTPLFPSPSCHVPSPSGRDSRERCAGFAAGVRKGGNKRAETQVQGGINWKTELKAANGVGWLQGGVTKKRHWQRSMKNIWRINARTRQLSCVYIWYASSLPPLSASRTIKPND